MYRPATLQIRNKRTQGFDEITIKHHELGELFKISSCIDKDGSLYVEVYDVVNDATIDENNFHLPE